MALAETARLLATYEVQDKSAAGIRSATSGLTGLQTRAKTFGTTLKTHVGGALSHFGGQLKNIASIGLASLGVAGLFGVVGAFRSVVTEAREFGEEVYRLQAITGLTAEATSRLTDALGDFGVESDTALRIAGLFEKNVQRLGGTKEKAAKFEKDYGLSLRDSSGNILDFNKQLLNSAAFFNDKTIPASQKAAGLAALYGRNWQALIPILKQGREGLQETLDTSLTLSEADIKAIEENRVATRKWNDAIGDLQVKIGVGLLPTITELVTSLTGWVNTHGPQIQEFFRNGVNTAKSVGGAVVSVLGGIKKVWDGIPDPIKDLLIKGFVAERTFKFLFGVSPIQIAGNLAGGLLGGLGKGLLGGLFARGASPANPMWVASVGGGLGGGPGGGVGPLGGGGLLPALGLAGIFFGVGLATTAALDAWTRQNRIDAGRNPDDPLDRPITGDDLRNRARYGMPLPYGDKRPAEMRGEAALNAIVRQDAADTAKLRDKIEASKIATVSAQRQSANRIVTSGSTSADRIVRALHATRPRVSVVVNVRGQVVGSYTSTGNFVNRGDRDPRFQGTGGA